MGEIRVDIVITRLPMAVGRMGAGLLVEVMISLLLVSEHCEEMVCVGIILMCSQEKETGFALILYAKT